MNRDRPWIMRTYAGHSTAEASNALYRKNLARGQTGLSIAFDLPTQTGYDPDHPLCRGEVGKVGVPVAHLGDMQTLMNGLPPAEMNTSMTINATAVWLYALYLANAELTGAPIEALRGTTQNDIVKEYLSRGTYVFPPAPSFRLATDLITHSVNTTPKWNPINICSYHLQEAGATPVQEIAFALVAAIGTLDSVRASGRVSEADFPRVVGRVSFFVNAGIEFVTEMCKMRAFVGLWDRICKERYGVEDPRYRRFRYGIQVNSLGLTEQQPENNIIRIVLEMLAVTLSKDARARAVQLPAWNEALGLPRPWDQQWSLRAQQILAFETDLLKHADLFEGSVVVEKKTKELAEEAWAKVESILQNGGAIAAVEDGSLKAELVSSNAERLRQIENGERVVVGVNDFVEGEDSPLVARGGGDILTVDPAVERRAIEALETFRAGRDAGAAERALDELKRAAEGDANLVPASIKCAHAGVTTGQWAGALRDVFGEFRAPTGLALSTRAKSAASTISADTLGENLPARADALAKTLGRRPKILIGKPGLDGHSNGAEQIALAARDAGFDVVYDGIRLTPARLATTALEEGVHVVGVSVLSGSHMTLVPALLKELAAQHVDVPVVVGGIIPAEDAVKLEELGVARVYTPKDFTLTAIMSELLTLVESEAESSPAP